MDSARGRELVGGMDSVERQENRIGGAKLSSWTLIPGWFRGPYVVTYSNSLVTAVQYSLKCPLVFSSFSSFS